MAASIKRICVLAITGVLAVSCLPCASAATTPLLVDNFDADTVGAVPAGWTLVGTAAGYARIENGAPVGNKWVCFHDDNSGDTLNRTLYRSFPAVTATNGSGRATAQFDVNLAQITAGFGTRLYNGSSPTTVANCATALFFEGNVEYAPGAQPGQLSYQRTVYDYVVTPLARTYTANTWCTVRVEANVKTRLYKLFFGPRGGVLTEITPSGGVPLILNTSGGQVSQIAGISFYSSKKDADTAGDLLIDNINVYMDEPEQTVNANTIAEARLLEKSTRVSLTDKIVTAGGTVFYIEDDTDGAYRTAGIRVRSSTPVFEGDRVDVTGRIAQSSEGNTAAHNGEREIIAEQVDILSRGNLVPNPINMRCRDTGGGWLGAMELLAEGYEPVLKGVWPQNAWGNSGVTAWSPADNSMVPLLNTGLLVNVIGKVVETTTYDTPGTNYDFYIDDGSLESDGWFATPDFIEEVFHPRGLRVRITDPAILSAVQPLCYGDWVKITGIAGAISCADLGRSSIRNVRVIRPRKPEDIQVIERSSRYVKFDVQGNCLVRGQPFFPIGIFTYSWDIIREAEIISQGFNTVTTSVFGGIKPSDLDQIHDDGIMVMPYMFDTAYRDAWLAEKDHPAILTWHLIDEPEGNGVNPTMTPAQMRADYEAIRQVAPTHPMGASHYLLQAFNDYRFAEDYTVSDIYPIHKSPITHVGLFIDYVHAYHGWGHPAWPFIQCFGGTEGYDVPSRAEERVMVYLALAHRAKGILFFSFYPSLTETWAEVKQLVTEMKQLTPFYCLPSSEPALGNTNANIHWRLIRIGDSGLIITVNPTSDPQTATFTIPSPAPTSLTLPVAGGTVPVAAGSFDASFDPLGVHVYQWGPTPSLL